jgi:ATP-binding cassette subfamily B protein
MTAVLAPSEEGDRRSRSRPLMRLLGEARSYWGHVGLLGLVSLAAAPLALLAPVPVQIAVDHVVGKRELAGPLAALLPDSWAASPQAILLAVVLLQIGLACLIQLQSIGVWLYSTWIGQRLVMEFRRRLFHRAQRLSLAHHDRRGSNDAVYRIVYDAPAIRHVVVDGFVPLGTSLLTLVAMVIVITMLSWQLALVALLVTPVLHGTTSYFSRSLRGAWHEVKRLESAAQAIVQQALSTLRVVKTFRREEHEEQRLVRVSEEELSSNVRVLRREGLFAMLSGLTVAAGTAGVLYLGVLEVIAGALTVGELWIVLYYLGRLYEPLKAIGQRITGLQRSLASAERAFALADEPVEVPERPLAIHLERAAGELRFEDVSFGYDAERRVLSEVSFAVSAGECVGIVGETGAGKSTLLSLLLRLYDPTAGRIVLDGIDLRHYRLDDLRSQFAVVLQEPVLFAATLAENIGYARASATREEIQAAALAAGAHEFIEALPRGYDTMVGERGMTLSGGERQRVALARAYLLDAPILILDEPTSAVDHGTEELLLESMERLMVGRTTLVIAHRPQTLRFCDRLLRVQGGRVRVELGPNASSHAAQAPAGG